jgi:hypothetical protein
MAEKKYVYPKPPSKEQLKREADARQQAMLQILNEREEKRRQAAKPKCWQLGWDESKQRAVRHN